jgi:hypothetical protein
MAKTKVTRSKSDARRSAAPQSLDDVRLLAREAALAALTRLAELAKSEDERVALAASQELLNRAFGKSISAAADDQGNAAQPLVIKIVRFGAEDADEPRSTSDRNPGAEP